MSEKNDDAAFEAKTASYDAAFDIQVASSEAFSRAKEDVEATKSAYGDKWLKADATAELNRRFETFILHRELLSVRIRLVKNATENGDEAAAKRHLAHAYKCVAVIERMASKIRRKAGAALLRLPKLGSGEEAAA